ncbi:hypothetical protein Y032_0105g3696 [Ancylostoma ceylanicum]|nr:hypothetical protein Y032_0105g3696 [Ancylostoma ceylanicum]
MHKRGSSVSEISKTLKLHREQVDRDINRFGETEGIENRPRGSPDRTARTLPFITPSKVNCAEILKKAAVKVEKTLFLQSVTVWGGISGLGKTKLVFVQQEVEIGAELHLKQILEDWAPAHGKKKALECCGTDLP